ncbi:hypothetical protein LXA43DRAFT_388065 [Ganoderma leucocontextum]|nr:hypothetical protein LXA43DRAFT_388065 [Ganoderma leucocontextum]
MSAVMIPKHSGSWDPDALWQSSGFLSTEVRVQMVHHCPLIHPILLLAMQLTIQQSAIPIEPTPLVSVDNRQMRMTWEDVWSHVSTIQKLEWSTTTAEFNAVHASLQQSTWHQLSTLKIIVQPSALTQPLSLDTHRFPALTNLRLVGVPIVLTSSFPRLYTLSLAHYPPVRYVPSFGEFATWLNTVASESLVVLRLSNYLPMPIELQPPTSIVPRIHVPHVKELHLQDVSRKATGFLFHLSHMPEATNILHVYHDAIPDNVDPFATILPPHAFLSGLDGFNAASVVIDGPYTIGVGFSAQASKRVLKLQVVGLGNKLDGPNGEVYLARLLAHSNAACRRLVSLPVKHLDCVSKTFDGLGLDGIPERTWMMVFAAFPGLEELCITDMQTGATASKILGVLTPTDPATGGANPVNGGRMVAPALRKLMLYTNAWPHEGMVVKAAPCAASRARGGAMLEEVHLASDVLKPECHSSRASAAYAHLGQWVKDRKVFVVVVVKQP